MDRSNLDEREKKLLQLHQKMVDGSDPVAGIRLDILAAMINELNGNTVLKEIFEGDVSSNLAIISKSDFGIFETKNVKLTESQKITFLKELNKIFEKYRQNYKNELVL